MGNTQIVSSWSIQAQIMQHKYESLVFIVSQLQHKESLIAASTKEPEPQYWGFSSNTGIALVHALGAEDRNSN